MLRINSYYIFLTLLISVHLFAEEIEEYEEMIVSATRWETIGVPTANSINVITREEIENSGAKRIVDVLQGQGGIQIRDLFGDGSRNAIDMRGFGATAGANTLILMDGRRLNNSDGHNPDINFISLKDVERIEIIEGSASVLFGDKAVGGVINIITETPDKLKVDAVMGYGSYNHQSQAFGISNKFDNGFNVRFTTEHIKSNNYRDNNRLGYLNGYARLGYDWNRGDVFVEFQNVREDLRLPGALFLDQINISRKQTVNPADYNNTDSQFGRIGGKYRLTDNWELATDLTVRDEDVVGHLTVAGFGSDVLQGRQVKSFNPRVRGTIPLGSYELSLIMGSDIEETNYFLKSSAIGFQKSHLTTQSTYFLATLPVDDIVSLTGGLRKAWMQHDIEDGFNFGAPRFPAGTELSDNQTVSSIGLSITPDNAWRLFLKRETSYRFPLVDEETNAFVPISVRGPLETQTGTSVEFGAEWGNSFLHSKVTGFVLELDNEIGFNVTSENINLDPTKRTGLIFDLNIEPFSQLSVDVQYTWIDAEFETGTNAGNIIPLVAEHQVHAGVNYKLSNTINLYGELFFVSDRFAGSDFSNVHGKLAGYGIGNLNINLDKGPFTIEVRANNILDKEYRSDASIAFNPFPTQETSYFSAPERNFFLSIGYTFE